MHIQILSLIFNNVGVVWQCWKMGWMCVIGRRNVVILCVQQRFNLITCFLLTDVGHHTTLNDNDIHSYDMNIHE